MAIDGEEYIGVSELAGAVGEWLSDFGDVDRKMKSGATEIPSERTIRFYLEKGLLPKPSKRLGQTLVFGRIHLLHLLVIKKLQADGVPLSSIAEILKKGGKTETQLEELLGANVASSDDAPPLKSKLTLTSDVDMEMPPLQHALAPSPLKKASEARRQELAQEEPKSAQPPPQTAAFASGSPDETPPPASEAKSFLKSLLSRSSKAPIRPISAQKKSESELDILFSRMPAPGPARWTRHEPVDGLEINISDDYKAPADEQGKVRLIEQLRKILGI